MPKTTSATIKLVLRTNKTLSTGLHPIMLTIQFNGKAEKSTGYSCSIDDWDKKNECIKNKKYPNVAHINRLINDFKQKAVSRKLDYEMANHFYTASMLLEEKQSFCGNKLIFKEMVDDYVKIKVKKYNTQKVYDLMLSFINKFVDNKPILITDITPIFCERFGCWLKSKPNNRNKQMEDASIRTIFSKIAAIFNYYIDKGVIDNNIYPFRKFKYGSIYKKSNRKQAIRTEDMLAIHGYFYDLVYGNYLNDQNKRKINFSFGDVCYRNGAYEKLQNRWSVEHSCAVFLFGWLAQGLAMVDIAKLKIEDVILKKATIKDEEKDVYVIYTNRSKTGKAVPIVIEKDDLAISVIQPFLESAFMRDNYLFPILQNNLFTYKYDTEKKNQVGLQTAEYLINKNLRNRIIPEVNDITIKLAQENKVNVELIPNITFYSMRHTFATSMIRKGVNPVNLATMMGRSPSGIFAYVKELTTIEDIATQKSGLY